MAWLLGFAFWTLVGLLFAFQFYIFSAKSGLEMTWRQALGYAMGDWYVYAVLSLPVVLLARFFRFETGNRLRSMMAHCIGCLIFSLAYMIIRAWVGTWQSGVNFIEAFEPVLVKTWPFNPLIYWVIVAVSFAFDYYRRYRERELRAAELERQLAESKLQALQMQLNPHFLFNSLHSISALMHEDLDKAEKMLIRLSDLLRATLDSSDTQEVALAAELKILNLYLDLEQIRFGERLQVVVEAPAELLQAQVPNLILQPLVENAIRHGVESLARPGQIKIQAEGRNGNLILEVLDNGLGLDANGPIQEGVGLSNTRIRLQTLYGDRHQFELLPSPTGGLLVRIKIPFSSGKMPT